MNNEIINELMKVNIVELIYVNKKQKEDKTVLTYNIVCNCDSITENIEAFKRINAIMEIIKTLLSTHNITLNYNIKTNYALEDAIENKDYRTIKDFKNSTIVFDRTNYFTDYKNHKTK